MPRRAFLVPSVVALATAAIAAGTVAGSADAKGAAGLKVAKHDAVPVHLAPFPNGPRARVFAGVAGTGPLAPTKAGFIEVNVPAGAAMPPHAHGPSAVIAYVASGRLTFKAGDDTARLGPGDAVLIPRGVEVSVANPGRRAARLLVVTTPAGFEKGVTTWPTAS